MTDQDFQKIGKLISNSEVRIIGEVGKFIEDSLLPVLEQKADKSDIDRLERKLDRIAGQVTDHEQSLKQIKSIPVIAHTLKIKRSK